MESESCGKFVHEGFNPKVYIFWILKQLDVYVTFIYLYITQWNSRWKLSRLVTEKKIEHKRWKIVFFFLKNAYQAEATRLIFEILLQE